MVDRETLVELLLGERKTIKEVARIYGVHRNTASKWVREFDIDTRLWWKYQSIFCSDCRKEIDPEREFSEKKRKRLLAKEIVVCKDCKEEHKRRKNREKQRAYRDRNRDYYNKYMRDYRRKRKLNGAAAKDGKAQN